jgi:hypothetical protein
MPYDPRGGKEILKQALDVLTGATLVADNYSLGSPSLATQRRRYHKPQITPFDGLRTAEEAAARLGCSIKTLKGHIAAGSLRYVAIGHGSKRPRKMFTDADLAAFIEAQTRKDSPACPSFESRARHTGTSISSGEVIDFTVPRKPRPDAPPKR